MFKRSLQAHNELLEILNLMIGKSCWSYIGGGSDSIRISLDFGEKIKRPQMIFNKHLTLTQRQYEGEIGLFIMCYWRIEDRNKIIFGAYEFYDDERTASAFENIIDYKVTSVELVMPSNDLQIHFENNVIFKIVCDKTDKTDVLDNWTIFAKNKCYTILSNGNIAVDKLKFPRGK